MDLPLPGLGPAPSGGPTTNSRRTGDDAGDLRQHPPAEFLASHRESTALGVGQAKWTWAKLLPEDPILLPEIIDHVFLVAVHPASGREYEEAQSVGHLLRLLGEQPLAPTLFRRFANLGRFLAPYEGLHLVLDSTGLSIVGEGEWAAAKHGGCGRRGWRKLHLGVDQSGVIRVHTLTEATGDDATTALDLLTAVEGPLVRVTADAAYDTVAVYETAGARGATVVIPPARTANVSGHGPRSPARDRTITLVKTLGRRQWKKASGYHRQSRVENVFFRYKSIIGDGLRARSPAGQGSDVVLGCEILNRMTALGRPVSYRIGR